MGRLFGRFQRLSAKPTAGEGSTGLGLSIVKRIAELHGGRVSAYSDGPACGSHLLDPPSCPVGSSSMSSAQHIIVVDDEPAAREMVGDYLRMHGFEVTLCDGGASLRLVMADATPDLVVLDLNMPDEDGLSIVRDLKSRPPVPIIMLTATASPIDRIVGLELGADDYVPKPCELRELVARIRSVLRRGSRPRLRLRRARPNRPPRPSGWEPAGSISIPIACGMTRVASRC